ncbi:hypothetical protein ACN6MY_20660 [Peribacillus sp. B-H-3]|uniref:hypothetical protein n=1 Tax=Peribacillus sp. B-H-3 TaxID=3400420 RepID=UPI003B02649E
MAVGFLLAFLERLSNTFLYRAFGTRGILFTAWLGTPIHELGHALMCVLFMHKIREIKFFQWNSPDGVLGYVSHEYNRGSVYQSAGNFFIGIAPVLMGITSLILGMHVLLPHSYHAFISGAETGARDYSDAGDMVKHAFGSMMMLLKLIFTGNNLLRPSFWLFLYLSMCISSHIALSAEDMKGAWKGLVVLSGLLVMFNAAAAIFHYNTLPAVMSIAKYNAYLLSFSSAAILFSFLTVLISYAVYKIKTG